MKLLTRAGRLIKHAGRLVKRAVGAACICCAGDGGGGGDDIGDCTTCGGCYFNDESYWTWTPPTLATSGWYYYGYGDLNEAAARFNAWTEKNHVGNYARITDVSGVEIACSWTINSEPWEYDGYDGVVLYRWAVGIHLGQFLKAELQVSFDTVTPSWFGVGFGVRSVGAPSLTTCSRMEWADFEIFHNAGPDNVPPDPATTSLGEMTTTITNNGCCVPCGNCCFSTRSIATLIGKPTISYSWGGFGNDEDAVAEMVDEFNAATLNLTLDQFLPVNWRGDDVVIVSPTVRGDYEYRFILSAGVIYDCGQNKWRADYGLKCERRYTLSPDDWNVVDFLIVRYWFEDSTCCRGLSPSDVILDPFDDPEPWGVTGSPTSVTLSNNKCCKCAGGGCVPTSDSTVSACDGEGANTCSESQDEDCNPFP